MLPKKQKKAWTEFYAAARHNDILDAKTTILIHLATALSAGCYP